MQQYFNRWWMVAAGLALVASMAIAGTTGKISGVITDRESGQPIPGAAIMIEGTTIGALSDEQGQFVMLNIPVGTYTLKASIVGYTPAVVQNVGVSVDLTTYQNFEITSRTVEMGGITVMAERPLVIKDQTSSLRIVSEQDVQNMPTRGYQDIVGLQAGAVRYSDNPSVRVRGARENSTTGGINLRGGRQSEIAYYVDGFSQQDPLSGLSTTQINNNSIKEVSVVTGGFNAEYGLIMSGAVNVTTKEGTSKLHGTAETVTDNFHAKNYDYNIYSLALNGPVIPHSDKLTFYAAGERRWAGDRDPRPNELGLTPGITKDSINPLSWYNDQFTTGTGKLPHNSSGLWNWQGKLNWRPSGNIAAKLGSIGSEENWSEYRRDYQFDIAHAPRYRDKNYSFWGNVTHTLSPKTFYTVAGSWFSTERMRGDGVYFDNLWAYGRPKGNPRFDASTLFWSWDNNKLDPDSLDKGVYFPLKTPTYTKTVTVPLPDGTTRDVAFIYDTTIVSYDTTGGVVDTITTVFADESSSWDDYLFRQSSYVGGDFDLVSQVNAHHEIKIGADFQRHTLRYYRHLFPKDVYLGANGGFKDADFYGFDATRGTEVNSGLNGAKHPLNVAGYIQDKFDWQGLIVNAGVRLDYFDYKTQQLRDPANPLDPFHFLSLIKTDTTLSPAVRDSLATEAGRLTEEDLTASKSVSRLSPRLGVGFPVAEGSVLHFTYGKFFQRPDLANLYVNYGYLEYKIKTGGYFYPFGNPNLKPEETTAYEVGWRRQLSDYTALDATAFYKDIKNLTEIVTQPAAPNSFSTYRNRDYGTVKGLELQLDMRRNRGISAQINYTLQYADGTGSFANSQSNIAWTVAQPPKQTSYLEFDQRHKLTGILDIRAGSKEGPNLGGFFPLERSGVNFVFSAGSGFPYSPSNMYNEVSLAAIAPTPAGSVNSRRGPWVHRLDLKANKEISLGGATLDLYLWVINAFDRKNPIHVYEVSGLPDETGWLSTPSGQEYANGLSDPHDTSLLTGEQKYLFRQSDPANFDTPRQIRFGVRYAF